MATYSAAVAASNIVELPRARTDAGTYGVSAGFRDDDERHADGRLLTGREFFTKHPGRVLSLHTAAPRCASDAGMSALPPNHVPLLMTERVVRDGMNCTSISLLIVPRDSVPVINVAGDCPSMLALARAVREDGADNSAEYLLRPAKCFRLSGPGVWEERFPPGKASASTYARHAKNAKPDCFGQRVHSVSMRSADIVELPKREWLAERALKRRLVSQIIAPGSAGKSLLTLQWAVAVALGRGEFTGLAVRERTRVLIVNLEDDLEEQKLRLAAVATQFGIGLEELHGWIHIYNPGEESAFHIAKRQDKRIVEGEVVADILEFASNNEIGLIIFDPLVEMNEADENNNTEMGAVMSVFKKIARTANAAVLFVHHTRKLDRAASDGHAGNVDSGRGASSIPNATRITVTLYNMSGSEAKALGIPDLERNRYVRLDDAKANQFLASGQGKWFKRTSVDLPNGEQVGVLVPTDLGANNRNGQCQLLASRIMVAALEAGRKLSPNKQATNSGAAYCVDNQGEADFTKAEFAKALTALSGFDFDVEQYASGGKTAERYVLVGQSGRFADGSGLDG
jgi:hypothetical protein